MEFNSVRERLAHMKTQLGECQKILPDALSELEKASKNCREKQDVFEKSKTEYSANESLWQQVSSLDGDIRNVGTQLKNAESDASKIVTEIGTTQKKIEETGNRISENE